MKRSKNIKALHTQTNLFNIFALPMAVGKAGPLGLAILFYGIGHFVFDLRDSTSVINASISPLLMLRGILLGGALFLIIPFTSASKFWVYLIKKWPLTLYVFLALISIIWSKSPVATLGKVGELIAALVIAGTLVSTAPISKIKDCFEFLLIIYFLQITISVIGFLSGIDFFTEAATGGFAKILGGKRAVGINFSANGIGTTSALLLLYVITIRDIKRYYLHILILSLGVILSSSRTALAIIGVGFLFRQYKKNGLSLLLLLLIISFVVIYNFEEIYYFLLGSQGQKQFLTLSGRTIMWDAAYRSFLNNWLTGNGWGVGSRSLFYFTGVGVGEDTIASVHNGLFEVLLGGGILLGIPWILSICLYFKSCYYMFSRTDSFAVALTALLPALAINTIMSDGVGGRGTLYFFIFALSIFYNERLRDMENKNTSRPPNLSIKL